MQLLPPEPHGEWETTPSQHTPHSWETNQASPTTPTAKDLKICFRKKESNPTCKDHSSGRSNPMPMRLTVPPNLWRAWRNWRRLGSSQEENCRRPSSPASSVTSTSTMITTSEWQTPASAETTWESSTPSDAFIHNNQTTSFLKGAARCWWGVMTILESWGKVRNTDIYWTIPLFQACGLLKEKWLDWKISNIVWSSLAASLPSLFSSLPLNPRWSWENLIKFWPVVTLPPNSVCSFGQRSGRVCWEWASDRPCRLYCWIGSTLYCPPDFQWVLQRLCFIAIFIHRICVLGYSFSCAHALPRIWKFSWITKKAKLSYCYASASAINFCEWLQRISHLKIDFLCLMMSVLRYFAQLHFWSYCVFCVSCRETIGWCFGSFYSFLAFPSVTPPWCFLHSCSPT